MTKYDHHEFFQDLNLNLWFIRLRWLACIISFLLVFLSVKIFNYLPEDNFWVLVSLIISLTGSNGIYLFFIKKNIFANNLKEIQIVTDLFILTAMLLFSGGIENPLSFIYILHVILSGILLNKRKSYLIFALAFLLYSSVALAEMTEIVPHYTLKIFPHKETPEFDKYSLEHTEQHSHELTVHTAHYPPYVWSMIALNFFLMGLTAYFITDIMESLRTEQDRTKLSHQKLKYVLKATNAGLIILDKNLNVVWFNEPIKIWSEIQLTKNNSSFSVVDKWISTEKKYANRTLDDQTIRTIERKKIDENGHIQYFQFTIAPLLNAKGEVYQVAELIQDISEKKIIEAEMLHTAEMVSLGTMAASIAHEVGNPLSSISTRLKLLETEHEPKYISKSISLLQNEIERIKKIVRDISQFGRYKEAQWELCNINQILSETIEILKYHKSAKNHEIQSNFGSHLSNILGVKDQLKQVFLNIGLNALQAMPDKGKLKIISKLEKGYLTVYFIDNGIGIKAEDKEKIRRLFFFTKKESSGLGLFIVNYFVNAHNGKMDITSNPFKGTEVKISFPTNKSQNVVQERKNVG